VYTSQCAIQFDVLYLFTFAFADNNLVRAFVNDGCVMMIDVLVEIIDT